MGGILTAIPKWVMAITAATDLPTVAKEITAAA
jgi:hypothetical protein